jgi:hypothetical protein
MARMGSTSVLVVVPVVPRVTVTVVDVVHVVAMRDRHMPATLAVHMVVWTALGVAGSLTFVVVTLVFAVQMAVVDVVDMVAVRDGDMTASRAVVVLVLGVLSMRCGHQNPSFRSGQVELKSTSHITKCA